MKPGSANGTQDAGKGQELFPRHLETPKSLHSLDKYCAQHKELPPRKRAHLPDTAQDPSPERLKAGLGFGVVYGVFRWVFWDEFPLMPLLQHKLSWALLRGRGSKVKNNPSLQPREAHKEISDYCIELSPLYCQKLESRERSPQHELLLPLTIKV